MNLKILPFTTELAPYFHDLNIEWLEHYFYVEPFDREVLSKPDQYIISKGGHIFFALEKNHVHGTVALMPTSENGVLELTKMAVQPAVRGRRIGHQLLKFCIDFAATHNYEALLLYSNTKLENAIHLYRKFGFKELKLEKHNPYERANIKMLLNL